MLFTIVYLLFTITVPIRENSLHPRHPRSYYECKIDVNSLQNIESLSRRFIQPILLTLPIQPI